MKSLAATWWNGADLSGREDVRETGVGHTDGDVSVDWGSGTPPGITSSEFSGRLTGTVEFPNTGTYELGLYVKGGARLHARKRLRRQRVGRRDRAVHRDHHLRRDRRRRSPDHG
ncbi:MAG: PA14 domain-containing protein [Acidimicrobiia bacterium]|nr:PA14 domain-containing protein [Acidimicrobiia bacterium]